MSRRFRYISISPFHDRLFSLVGDDIPGWAAKIGVTPALIRDKWLKGSYPGADKIIKICEVSELSPDALLMGRETTHTDTPVSTWPDEIKSLCLDLKEIWETADDTSKLALQMNMSMIKDAVKAKARSAKDEAKKVEMDRRIKKIERDKEKAEREREALRETVNNLNHEIRNLKRREPQGCADTPGDSSPASKKAM